MFDKQWLIQEGQKPYDFEMLLSMRGISASEQETFLRPSWKDLEDPSNPVCMAQVVERILVAADTGEQITVFGDYDADGITATTILVHFLRFYLQAQVDFYIPDRFTEGYGISPAAIDKLKARGTSLIITVDNGVAAIQAAQRAQELAMDLIITDHHQCPEELPPCLAILNPHLPDSGFLYEDLAGVGVAYTLIRALGECIGLEDEVYAYLPIVALGTVGDCMPLTKQNRILVYYGLSMIKDGNWIGLQTLLQKSGFENPTEVPLSSVDLSFRIIPKLNAAGRLGNAEIAVTLLLSSSVGEAAQIAEALIETNRKRQETEEEIYREALEGGHLLSQPDDVCVIAYGKDWHQGVIGIVASRLVEQYDKPAFVFSGDEAARATGLMKGSARSVPGFHLYDALSSCKDVLEKYGGHEMAAGLTIREENIPAMIATLNRYGKEIYAKSWKPAHLVAESILLPEQVTVSFVEQIMQMEPFGEGNPQPIFIISGLSISKVQCVGKENKHLRVSFKAQKSSGEPIYLDGIAFGQGAMESRVRGCTACSVLCKINLNVWNGIRRVSLQILDIHDFHIALDKKAKCLYNNACTTFFGFVLTRDLMKAVYKAIVSLGARWTYYDLPKVRALLCKAGISCSWYLLDSAISIFTEIGMIQRDAENYCTFTKMEGKFNLSASSLYRAIASTD